MYEVEVKVRADLAAVRDRLENLDAEALGRETQRDTYFDHPVRDFAETDEALRVRETEDRTELTYKGSLVEDASKTREEVQTAVADGDAIRDVLTAVGFEPVAEVRKVRERYRLGEYTVTLDDVTGAGEFVEVETIGSSDDIEPLREGAYDVLRRLDLNPGNQLQTSYLELVLAGDN